MRPYTAKLIDNATAAPDQPISPLMFPDTTARFPSNPSSIMAPAHTTSNGTMRSARTSICIPTVSEPTYESRLQPSNQNLNNHPTSDQPPSLQVRLNVLVRTNTPTTTSPLPCFGPKSNGNSPVSSTLVTNIEANEMTNFLQSIRQLPGGNTLLLLNARSILPKWHYLQVITATIMPSFIMITETWLTENIPDAAISLPGYSLHRADRQTTIGGGCLIYSSQQIPASRVNDPAICLLQDSVWISTTHSYPTLLLGCIYLPPSPTTGALRTLSDVFQSAHSMPHDVKLIAGDFNLPDITWQSSNSSTRYRALLTQIACDGWLQHVKAPTRHNHVLDLIFSNGRINISTSVGPYFPGSDHRMVFCNIDVMETLINPHMHCFYHISPDILSAFAKLVRTSDWTAYFLSMDVQAAADRFYEFVTTIWNSVSPLQNRLKQVGPSSKTERSLLAKIHRLRNKHTKTGDLSILIVMQKTMQRFSDLKKTNEESEEQKAIGQPDSSNRLATLYRKRCSHNSDFPCRITTHDNTVLCHPVEIANSLNTFFSNCYAPANSQGSNTLQPINENNLTDGSCSTLSHISITLDEVSTNLRTLKESSAPGPDGLPPSLLKNGGPDLPLLLLNLFQHSLNDGVVPTQWKYSIVTPRWKCGPRTKAESYRGIHHTCHLLRVLERIIKVRVLNHILSNRLIHDQQYGFLPKRSVINCQVSFFAELANASNEGKSDVIIYLDVSKIFDKVPHEALLIKLRHAGIAGSLHNWFRSYLSDRTQATAMPGALSAALPITSGVIQGSVLGPVLFLIYINSIFSSIKHGQIYLFADDIKIVYTFPSRNLATTALAIQDDLNDIYDWSMKHGLSFSVDKCHVLGFRCLLNNYRFLLGDSTLQVSDSIKDLGIRYSCNLDFSSQALYQIARARQVSSIILRSFHLSSVKLALFKQRVRPILEYCPFLASQLTKANRLAIERVQRNFTKALFSGGDTMTYRLRCERLNLDPLWLRRIKLNLTLFHKLIYRHSHLTYEPPYFFNNERYALRNTEHIVQYRTAKTVTYQYSFFPLYSHLWNRLPASIRSISDAASFQRQLNLTLQLEKIENLFNLQESIDHMFEEGPPRV